MYDPLVVQFEKAYGLENKQKLRRKRFFMRMSQYKTYKKTFGEKRAQKLIIGAISKNKL